MNNQDEVAYLYGPLSSTAGICIPAPTLENPANCYSTIIAPAEVHLIESRHVNGGPATVLRASAVRDDSTVLGPFAKLGPAFSLGANGQLAFVSDFNANPNGNFDRRLATRRASLLFNGPLAADFSTRPVLAENGRMPLKDGPAENSPLVVWEYNLASSTEVASVAKGFDWTGQYPGITDSGQRVASISRFIGITEFPVPTALDMGFLTVTHQVAQFSKRCISL